MLGLTFDKLILVVMIGALVVGPHRLPKYAQNLADTLRAIRRYVELARGQVREVGAPFDPANWQEWDLRRYDPRRVIHEVLTEPPPTGHPLVSEIAGQPVADTTDREIVQASTSTSPVAEESDAPLESPEPTSVGSECNPEEMVVVISGTSGHPRRILVPASQVLAAGQVDADPSPARLAGEIDGPAVGLDGRLDDRHAQAGRSVGPGA